MRKTVLSFGWIAVIVAIVRFFLKDILDSFGIPSIVGSMLASITLLLLIGTVVIFRNAGKDPNGTFLYAAGWLFLLSAWCQILIISGILLTEWTNANTYFAGPWEAVKERFPTGRAHAIAHTQGFWILTAILMIVGSVTYVIARRTRVLSNERK